MDAPHRSVGQAQIGFCFCLRNASSLFGTVVELLDLDGCELLQLHFSDAGFDVIANVAFIVVCRGGTQMGLGVGFIPKPHPFAHRVVAFEVDGRPPVFMDSLLQSFACLGLGLAEHTFHDAFAGVRIVAFRVAAFPSSIRSVADAAFAVCSSFCHCSIPPFVTRTYTTLPVK